MRPAAMRPMVSQRLRRDTEVPPNLSTTQRCACVTTSASGFTGLRASLAGPGTKRPSCPSPRCHARPAHAANARAVQVRPSRRKPPRMRPADRSPVREAAILGQHPIPQPPACPPRTPSRPPVLRHSPPSRRHPPMPLRRYLQLDVFADRPGAGNPLAVVLDAEGMDDATMQSIARWTRLPETTFVFPPTTPGAGYRVRMFSPHREVPFAGHPSVGTAFAVLDAELVMPTDGILLQ